MIEVADIEERCGSDGAWKQKFTLYPAESPAERREFEVSGPKIDLNDERIRAELFQTAGRLFSMRK